MKFINYIKQLINSRSKESSKRFIALFTTLGLMTYVVFGFTRPDNAVWMLTTLCSFVLAILGVAAWQDVKKSKKDVEA
jgi:hypothetical protein